MKCPFCEKENKKSELREHGSSSTLLGLIGGGAFYDEEGEYHFHDINKVTTSYSCSNGHRYSIKRSKACPNDKCNFGKTEEPVIKLF